MLLRFYVQLMALFFKERHAVPLHTIDGAAFQKKRVVPLRPIDGAVVPKKACFYLYLPQV
jgi:hypothetical protein